MSDDSGASAPSEPEMTEAATPSPRSPGWWSQLPRAAKIAIPAAAVAVIVVVIVAVAAITTALAPNRFEAALSECDLAEMGILLLADDNKTLILDMEGDEAGSGLLPFEDVQCVLYALDTPSSTLTLMGSTRAMDGRQSDSWDGIEASWSYHPDNGLDVILELD